MQNQVGRAEREIQSRFSLASQLTDIQIQTLNLLGVPVHAFLT